jgi:hypothetical protein
VLQFKLLTNLLRTITDCGEVIVCLNTASNPAHVNDRITVNFLIGKIWFMYIVHPIIRNFWILIFSALEKHR